MSNAESEIAWRLARFARRRHRRLHNNKCDVLVVSSGAIALGRAVPRSNERGLPSIGDAFIRQLMLMPNGVENAATAGKANAEDPGEIPHRFCSLRAFSGEVGTGSP